MRVLLLALVVLVFTACAHEVDRLASVTPAMTSLPERLPPDEPRPLAALGPGDILEVKVVGAPAAQNCPVGLDGRIYVEPATVGFMAAGKTQQEVAAGLAPLMADWYREPIVEVRALSMSSPRALVLGEVERPGPVILRGGERILDLIAASGGPVLRAGLEDTISLADLSGAMYVRQGRLLPVDLEALIVRGDTRYNITVHSGDYLYVPAVSDRMVYILGAVNAPGSYSLRGPITISKAIALAAGYTPDAYIDRLILVRGSRSKPLAARIDLDGILAGRLPDTVVKRGDILYLPGRTSENPRFLLDLANTTFLSTIASAWADQIYQDLR